MMINKKWMEFKFDEIFNIQTGYFNKKPPSSNKGTIPYIGASALNNGITGLYTIKDINNCSKKGIMNDNSLEGKIFEGNCITVNNNGSVGYAFYQNNRFTGSQDINILYLKNYKLNKFIALFLILMIEQQKDCFKYSYKWKPARMKKSLLMLPINENNEPDYQYMENYAKNLFNKKNKKYLDYITKRESELEYKPVPNLISKNWEQYCIGDLFTISSGKRLTKANMKHGTMPFIGATSLNNGITNYVSNINNSIDENVLGVNYNGSVVENFYHPYTCLFSDDVKRFHLKNYPDNRYVLLFFKSIILKQKVKYMYGYKFNANRMEQQIILVPVNDDGDPDYKYMEQYMMNLEIEQLNKYKNHI